MYLSNLRFVFAYSSAQRGDNKKNHGAEVHRGKRHSNDRYRSTGALREGYLL